MKRQGGDAPEPETIGVVGFGTMGAGVVEVLASAGHQVVVLERDSDRLEAGWARLETGLARPRRDDPTSKESAVRGRVRGSLSVSDLAEADLVIETVTEDHALKMTVLREVADAIGAEIPLLTNTSALSVTELAARLPSPERVAGLHFFNPVPVMRTVEVVVALQTAPELVRRLEALVNGLSDKTAVVVKDRPGFLVNALLFPYLNDVVAELDADLASAHDIDLALKLGLGYKSGPLEMIDRIGLDVHLSATTALHEATGDARYAPPPLLRRMVDAGRLGLKNGRGFRTGEPDGASKTDRESD